MLIDHPQFSIEFRSVSSHQQSHRENGGRVRSWVRFQLLLPSLHQRGSNV